MQTDSLETGFWKQAKDKHTKKGISREIPFFVSMVKFYWIFKLEKRSERYGLIPVMLFKALERFDSVHLFLRQLEIEKFGIFAYVIGIA